MKKNTNQEEWNNPLTELTTEKKVSVDSIKNSDNIMLITGIASPEQMINDLEPYTKNIKHLCYPDHHDFTANDIEQIKFFQYCLVQEFFYWIMRKE